MAQFVGDPADLVREQGIEGPVVIGGQPKPLRVIFTRACTDAAIPHQPAAGRPTDRQSPAALLGGDLYPAARHFRLHAPVVLVRVPCPAAPPEGPIRLQVSDGLVGFPRIDLERAPHYALTDPLFRGSVAPVAQRGTHGVLRSSPLARLSGIMLATIRDELRSRVGQQGGWRHDEDGVNNGLDSASRGVLRHPPDPVRKPQTQVSSAIHSEFIAMCSHFAE